MSTHPLLSDQPFPSKSKVVNFAGLRVPSRDDIERIYSTVAARLEPLGHKVYTIVNDDGFDIDRELFDVYSDMVHTRVSRYYLAVTGYTTSAFLRMRLVPRLGSMYAPARRRTRGWATAGRDSPDRRRAVADGALSGVALW